MAAAVIVVSIAAGTVAGAGAGEPNGSPEVDDVRCIAKCAGLRRAAAGSRVELSGRDLGRTVEVRFNHVAGGRISVAPLTAEWSSVTARVPDEAATGKPIAVDRDGNGYISHATLTIVDESQVLEEGDFELRRVSASPKFVFFFGLREAQVTYAFRGTKSDLRVGVIDRRTDRVVRTMIVRNREPFVQHTLRWNGNKEGGAPAPAGPYRFAIGLKDGGRLSSGDNATFNFYGYIFPLRAPHSYGAGIGAGRGHRGQDLAAACGSDLVAARGGEVEWKAYQGSGAGYYLVIDEKGTGRDHVYMHMNAPARPSMGDTVRTGEKVGEVGSTGNSTGCHLHFEIWSAPGWYEGGNFTNPTDDLKRWDSYS